MSKIKVMHVLNTGGYSGAENVVITMINGMKTEFDFIYVSPEGMISDILKENDIKHYSLKSLNISELKKAIRDYKPDIIHAHDFTAGVICSATTNNIPIINHLHQNAPWIKNMNIKSFVYSLFCNKFKKILCVSKSVIDESIFSNKISTKSKVVGNPINFKMIFDKAEKASCSNKSDILFLGRLEEPKNPIYFIEILHGVIKKHPSFNVAIVGEGSLRETLEQKIKELNLTDNIQLYGFKQNPYGILKNTKLLCLPSKWEGFGLVAVEALLLGKPVVASPVGGLVNIVNDNCGKLCKDKQEFVNEIIELLENEEYYNEKSKNALDRSIMFDNINQYTKEIYETYLQCIGDKK